LVGAFLFYLPAIGDIDYAPLTDLYEAMISSSLELRDTYQQICWVQGLFNILLLIRKFVLDG
jgi:hypothetical protein